MYQESVLLSATFFPLRETPLDNLNLQTTFRYQQPSRGDLQRLGAAINNTPCVEGSGAAAPVCEPAPTPQACKPLPVPKTNPTQTNPRRPHSALLNNRMSTPRVNSHLLSQHTGTCPHPTSCPWRGVFGSCACPCSCAFVPGRQVALVGRVKDCSPEMARVEAADGADVTIKRM